VTISTKLIKVAIVVANTPKITEHHWDWRYRGLAPQGRRAVE